MYHEHVLYLKVMSIRNRSEMIDRYAEDLILVIVMSTNQISSILNLFNEIFYIP